MEFDNSQSLCSFIYQLARVLKWSVLVSVTSLISIAVLCWSVIAPAQMPNQWQARKPVKTNWSCRALATYKHQTPFTALVKKPATRKMNEFFKETIFFFIFCFSFLLIVFKFRATGILCFPNNRKYKSDRMLNFSLMRSAFRAKRLSACWRTDRDFCKSRNIFTLEMSKMICYDLAMGDRAEILEVWLYFRVWYAVGAKIVRWRYRQVPCIQLCRFLTDFLHVWFFPRNLQGNPFTIMSLSLFKLTVCARRYSHRRISKWSRLSTVRREVAGSISGAGLILRVLK